MLRVVTRVEPPYVMVKCDNCTGNERYEGFAIDLLHAISQVTTWSNQWIFIIFPSSVWCVAARPTYWVGKIKITKASDSLWQTARRVVSFQDLWFAMNLGWKGGIIFFAS